MERERIKISKWLFAVFDINVKHEFNSNNIIFYLNSDVKEKKKLNSKTLIFMCCVHASIVYILRCFNSIRRRRHSYSNKTINWKLSTIQFQVEVYVITPSRSLSLFFFYSFVFNIQENEYEVNFHIQAYCQI